MQCKIQINLNHDSFHPDWRRGLAIILSGFCSKLSISDSMDVPQKFKLYDINGVHVGDVGITEEDHE